MTSSKRSRAPATYTVSSAASSSATTTKYSRTNIYKAIDVVYTQPRKEAREAANANATSKKNKSLDSFYSRN